MFGIGCLFFYFTPWRDWTFDVRRSSYKTLFQCGECLQNNLAFMELAGMPSRPILLFFLFCIVVPSQVLSQEKDISASPHKHSDKIATELTLLRSAICERIKDFAPENQAVVFSVKIGKIFCFTHFDPVPEKSDIYHSWYYRDKLITKQKLSLRPPRWSTYSSIQLREYDKGPWRVTITDQANKTLGVLRFSITN